MPPHPTQPALFPDDPPAATPKAVESSNARPASPDARRVLDTLCVLQAPGGLNRLADMMDAGSLRTQRGSKFNSAELRPLVDALIASGHVGRDFQGRLQPSQPHAWTRLRAILLDAELGRAWFEAWAKFSGFDKGHTHNFQEVAPLAAALRLVLYGGRTQQVFDRLAALAERSPSLWSEALRDAVLHPFDADLFDLLEPALQLSLADTLMTLPSGFPEAGLAPLEDWLLARRAGDLARLPPPLRSRLVETLLFRGDFAAASALCATLGGGPTPALAAALQIAQGQWQAGATAFQLALKTLGGEAGRRKNLVSPSIGWLYPMALLAQAAPAEWVRARKFAQAESSRREAYPRDFWGVWQVAIDQRLGDVPKAPAVFALAPLPASQGRLPALQALHHLLLAAWLRIAPAKPALLQPYAERLALDFEQARMGWLAQLTRRAAAALLGVPPAPADAEAPFFVGESQDAWRDALASILALGAPPSEGRTAVEPGASGRLIWVVTPAADGRIEALEPMEQKAGPRGLGKPKPISVGAVVKRADLPPHDAALLRAMLREEIGNRPVLDLVAAAPTLVGHPHVAWSSDPLRFIEVTEALPGLEVMTHGEHIAFRLLDPLRTPELTAQEAQDALLPQRWRQQRVRWRNTLLLADGDRHARLIRLSPAQLRVAELVAQGWKVPVAARAELDAALRVLAAHFQVTSDADAGHDVAPDVRLRAELTPQGAGLSLRLLAAPFGDFGPRLPPGEGRARVTTVHQGATLSTQRDLAAETATRQRLLDAVDGLGDEGHEWLLDDPEQALAAVEALAAHGAHIVSEWPKGKPLRVRPVAAAAVQVRARSKGDWLELDGALQMDDGQVLQLRQLLDLVATGRGRYLALADGDFLALGDALRQQLADLAALAQTHPVGGAPGQRLSAVAALAWEASGHSLTIEGDAVWRKRSDAWSAAQATVPAAPAGLQADLRDYQLEGYRWLARLAASGFGAVLADDMGLGKTVQTLALLLLRASGGPALVVAPTSVCGNWLLEAARFAPGLQVALYGDVAGGEAVGDELDGADGSAADAGLESDLPAGDAAAAPSPGTAARDAVPATSADDAATDHPRRAARRRQVRALGPGQLLVCSYALLQIDADILASIDWHSAVLDEAQAIKNPAAARTKAALALRSDFRLALTGTPIENRLAELWSIMGFCNPGLLGSAEQFNRRFATPIEQSTDATVKAQAGRRLRRLLSPFLLRRSKAEVLTDLPARTDIVHDVVPPPRERAFLEALRQQAQESVAETLSDESQSTGQRQFHVLAALTRLRRAACDPRLVAPELAIVGAKVHEFERLAIELVAGRHKALVFSQFTDFLKLLRERLDLAGLAYQYLDGATPAAERSKRVAAFQAGSGDLFLISLKAGGFGLNLTVADYVIIADPWWNPAAEEQASARAHRMGQQRPVTVYRLVTQGSIEEKIVRLHRSKRDLADGILRGDDGSAPVDAAQLLELLQAE